MQQALVEQLLSDFGYYRAQTQRAHELMQMGKRMAPRVGKNTRAGKEIAIGIERMVAFCAEHHLDARLWLYFLFRNMRWKQAPRPNQFCSLKTLEKYKAFRASSNEAHVPRAYIQQQAVEVVVHQQQSGAAYDVNRDITHSAEALKYRYVTEGDYERCMAQMATATYGFHPRSKICTTCPAAQLCEQRLRASVNFDIVALRRAGAGATTHVS